MIELFVKRPAMTAMFVLVFVVLGLVSYKDLIIERTPKIDLPLVSIKTLYPGATPAEIESQIIKKIEDAIAEISEIKKIESTAAENYGYVMIEFNIEADVNIKAIEVKDKVEAIINDLPTGAKKPEIAKFDPLVQPIMELVLMGDNIDDRTLYEYADKKLKNLISVINGVASVELIGGKKRQINIHLDESLMKERYISINEVLGELTTKNINVPGGNLDSTTNNVSVRFVGEFENVDSISNTLLTSKEGTKFKLTDISVVEDSYKKVETLSQFNGQNVVGLSIKKLSDGDAVSIASNVYKALDKIKNSLPKGMELKVANDSTTIITKENNSTIINIIYGLLLTVVILFLFLCNISSTIIASIVIPTSLISTFFLMDLSGFSINMMTLLAMATSLGTLIANALVIMESITTQIDSGKDKIQASIDGTKQVTIAVLASAGTNLVVFSPIAFMGGIVGQFMQQFGLTVVYATLFSILASFSLTPCLCALLLKPCERRRTYRFPEKIKKLLNYMVREYKKFFDLLLRKRWTTVGLTGLFMICLLYPMGYIGSEFFGHSDENLIIIDVKAPMGTAIENTQDVVSEIETIIKDIPELKHYLSNIGKDGEQNAEILVDLIPKEKRKRTDKNIISSLIPELAKIAGAEITLKAGEKKGGAQGDISINLYGTDYDKMIELSKEMNKKMDLTGFFITVDSSYKNPKDEIRFHPDQTKMINFGVNNLDLGQAIRNSINGNDTLIYKEAGEEYKINIDLADDHKLTLEDVAKIGVMTGRGLAPISILGDLSWDKAYPDIKRRDKQRVIQLNGYLAKSTSGQVQKILDEEFKKIEFPDGYGYKYVGEAEFFDESAREIVKAFILAVILTYMLLVALLNSFVLPLIIASTIITSFSGVFLLMFFFEYSINIGSMMAMVMLVGIVVNNAILMIEQAMQEIEKGMDYRSAIWEGASKKFRAILMTSLAIVVGIIPQLIEGDQTKAGMGGVIVGGVIGSIIFTFILVPVLFDLIYGRKNINRVK